MTVDKDYADKIADGNGWSTPPRPEDEEDGPNPPVVLIVEYDNNWGGKGYGCVFEGENPEKYTASPFVHNPRTYWVRGKGRARAN